MMTEHTANVFSNFQPQSLGKLTGKFAPITSVLLFTSSYPTIRKMVQEESVGSNPLLPYTSMAVNGYLGVTYGVLKEDWRIWSSNGVGLLLSIWYMYQFIRFSPKGYSPTLPGSVSQHLLGAGAISGVATALALSGIKTAVDWIGTIGVVLCVVMFASPLAALETVWRTQSAKSIPLPFACMSAFNCSLWIVTGLMEMNDFNVWFPNLLGLILSLAQIALKIIFYGNDNAPSKKVD